MIDNGIEYADRADIERLQLSRLKNMIDYCIKNVPFYRRKLSEAGIFSSDAVRSLADIVKIPFTTKEELQHNLPDGMLAVPKDKIVRIHSSSGSTGKPIRMFYTQNDLKTWSNAAARVLMLNGLKSGDVFQISVGYGMFTGAFGFHGGAELLPCTIVPASTGNTSKQLDMIRDLGVTVLMATPSYAVHLSELIKAEDPELKNSKLRVVMLGAERCTDKIKKTIKDDLGVRVADNYGFTECMGPGFSGECEYENGLHVLEDIYYPEIVDPDTGAVLPDNERGELVFTSLEREAVPLLRYRTHDISSLDHALCACGRTTVRMEAPKARTDDLIVFKGVKLFPSQIEKVLSGFDEISAHYALTITRDERCVDRMILETELKPGLSYPDADHIDDLRRVVVGRLKDETFIRMECVFCEPGTLPRFTGKAGRVKDKRYD